MVKNRRPSRDDGCCSVHFLKYVLFIFNFIFYLAGLAIVGVGLWTLFWESDYVALLVTKTYVVTAYILIAAGVLVLFVGILGCVGVAKENRCCLLMFTFLLLLVFLVEAVGGVLAYIYSEQVQYELQKHLKNTMQTKYSVDTDVTEAVDKLQSTYGCCGAINYTDWQHSVWYKNINSASNNIKLKVPDQCCKSPGKQCGERDHPSNIYYDGCLDEIRAQIQRQEIIVGAVALGFSLIQIFGLILSCCLFVKLKDFEDEKRSRQKGGSASYY